MQLMQTNTSNIGRDDSGDIVRRIAQITSENTPFMQQARTQGLQQANRRGLSNSSMAAGASQAEAIRAAAPIASAEAEMASRQREAQLGALTSLSGQRMNAIAATLQNPDLPAQARTDALRSYNDQFSQIANYLQNLYGVRLDQNAPGGSGVPVMPSLPSAPPIMGVPRYVPPNNIELYRIRGLAG